MFIMIYLDKTGVENDENQQRSKEHEQTVQQVLVEYLIRRGGLQPRLHAAWQHQVFKVLLHMQQQRMNQVRSPPVA